MPYEFQYENKPPLLFLIFYIFSVISQKSLLLIKIINDLIVFLLSISLIKLYGNNKYSYWNIIPGIAFIALSSNVWFHPNYSEYLLLIFVVATNYIYEKSEGNFKYTNIGVLLALSTLINLGRYFFIKLHNHYLYKRTKSKNSIKKFIFGFSFVHLLTGLTYFIFGAFKEYIMSFLIIPYSYSSSDTTFWSSVRVFIQAMAEFNLFLYALLIILISIASFKAVLLIRNLNFNNHNLEIVLHLFASILFFGIAGKGYYHHLIPFIYFLPACLYFINKTISKGLIIFLLVFSFIGVNEIFLNQSINNIKNIETLEENYPTKKAYNQIKNLIDDSDVIFSTENILLLYYLDSRNSSYIVHPALYDYSEVTSVLERSNKIVLEEVEANLQLLPEVVEGSNFDESLIDKDVYQEIILKNINFELLNYWDDGVINIYIKR